MLGKERSIISSNIFLVLSFFSFWDPYVVNIDVFKIVPGVSVFIFKKYSVLQQWFPPFCSPGHLSVLLPQLFCYWFLLVYYSGEGNGTPFQYSCLENPMDGGAWKAAVHGGCWGSDTTERLHFHSSLLCIGEGNGNPLQCSCLENPRNRRAWWAAVCGVAQSRTRLKQLSSSVLFISVCLFFSLTRLLVNISCFFSIVFLRSWIILTIIILNSFSGTLLLFWWSSRRWQFDLWFLCFF